LTSSLVKLQGGQAFFAARIIFSSKRLRWQVSRYLTWARKAVKVIVRIDGAFVDIKNLSRSWLDYFKIRELRRVDNDLLNRFILAPELSCLLLDLTWWSVNFTSLRLDSWDEEVDKSVVLYCQGYRLIYLRRSALTKPIPLSRYT
jgi:hypothetical protein